MIDQNVKASQAVEILSIYLIIDLWFNPIIQTKILKTDLMKS